MLRTLLLATLLVPVASMHAAAQSRGGGCNDLSCSFRLLQRPAGDTIWASSEEWTRSGFFYSNGRVVHYNGASLLQWRSIRLDIPALSTNDVIGIGWEKTSEQGGSATAPRFA